MPYSISDAMVSKLEEQIANHERYILDGGFESLVSYKSVCGELAGYRWALSELKGLLSSPEDDL